MSIPAEYIVSVNPRLIDSGANTLDFNSLVLTRSDRIPADLRVLQFAGQSAVASYFGEESPEAAVAAAYFLGYNNSFRKPRLIYFAKWADEELAPWLEGSLVEASLADFAAMSAGFITIQIGSHTASLQEIDFSAVTSYSEAALVLQSAIRAEAEGGEAWSGATVTFTSSASGSGYFRITGGASGNGQIISHPTGDVAELMRLTSAAGSVTSPGLDAQTPAQNMEALLKVTSNWVCFFPLFEAEESASKQLAVWSNGKGERFLYLYNSLAAALRVPLGQDNIGTYWQDLGMSAVTGLYGTTALAAFIGGTAASIDWNRRNGTITFAFKGQDGQEITCDDETLALALEQKGFNYYGDYATANDNFRWFYPGQMFGRWKWLDRYLNAVWLKDNIQVAMMVMLRNFPRIPYNEEGYSILRANMQDVIDRALFNGVISRGISLSESQKAQIQQEAGQDISADLEQNGWYFQVLDPGATARSNRESPIINFWYTDGGSIHKLQIPSTAVV